MTQSMSSTRRQLTSLMALLVICCGLMLLQHISHVNCQLPDDIQRELNQNLAEQARIQAQRARHQQMIQARAGGAAAKGPSSATPAAQPQAGGQAHDPNNYSYQQVSPPIQYSYYQPYGDLAKPQQQQQAQQAVQPTASAKPINIDLNNLNFDDLPNLPAPQAQTATSRADHGGIVAGQPQRQAHLTPSFTGVGGLPVLQPLAAANQAPVDTLAPVGKAPLPPQAQQGPPLTEADFKDITGGENYGAPGGSDFGMGGAGGGSGGGAEPRQGSDAGNQDDAQLREFGMPNEQEEQQQQRQEEQPASGNQRADDQMQNLGMSNDFGNFNPMSSGGGSSNGRRASNAGGFDPFGGSGGGPGGLPFGGDFGNLGGSGGGGGQRRRQQPAGEDFDFASQPSSRSQGGRGGGGGDSAQATLNGAAPGSLQSLLGNAFPGLGGGNGGNMGLDSLARGGGGGGGNNGGGGDQSIDTQLDSPQRQQRADDGSLDVAELGDRADGFGGADLGGFEQPGPQNDQDYNYAAAAEQQPKSVPYPDGGPQFVGTVWALSQPQSLTQTRYNPQPDHGTYQDYPAYKAGGNDFSAVRRVVDSTPRARPPGPGRYGHPSPSALAPEFSGARMDYSQAPRESLSGLSTTTNAHQSSDTNAIDGAANKRASDFGVDDDDEFF